MTHGIFLLVFMHEHKANSTKESWKPASTGLPKWFCCWTMTTNTIRGYNAASLTAPNCLCYLHKDNVDNGLGLHHTCFFLHFHPQWRVAGNHLMLLVLKYAPFTAKTMHIKEWCLPSVWGHGFFYKRPGMINVAISWCVTAQTPRTHCAYLWNATRFHIAAVLDTLAIRTYCIEDVCKDCCEHF